MDDHFDMETLRLPEDVYLTSSVKDAETCMARVPAGEPDPLMSVASTGIPASGRTKAIRPSKRKRPFIYKDLAWMQGLYACTASAVILRLADLLWYYQELRKEAAIKVTPARCHAFHLDRKQRLRGLKALEAHGLITVQWSQTKSPIVTLILPPNHEENPA